MGQQPEKPVPGASEDPTRTIETITAAPGALIGPYRLIRQLGEGGMGVVYHAQQLQPIRREVALKIIKPGMDSKQVIARFESERQALAMMDHTNIARVFDAGTTAKGIPYFVMELVSGVPITRYCDSKRLTIQQRIELFIPVCEAIQHAHQKGIIHRDIKPSNILVAEYEGKATAKVIDFGLAKALGQQLSGATMMTNVGTLVGTLDYMSPEQAELGRHDIDTRTDVYSLGAVLYELLTGTTPLERKRLAKASYIEALHLIRDSETRLPSTRLRESGDLRSVAALRKSDPARLTKLLDRELDWIAVKTLEKDRMQRYPSAADLAADLQRYLKDEPIVARPASASYQLQKFARRHKTLVAAVVAVFIVLVVGIMVSTWEALRARRAERAALTAEQTAKAVNDFLQKDLLAQASSYTQARPGAGADRDLKVRTALDRAAQRIEGKFAAQPLVEASIRQTIGSAYIDLGLFSEAQRQLERALQLRIRVLGEAHPDALEVVTALGDAYNYNGDYEKAKSLLIQALEVERRWLPKQHPTTLTTMNNLGQAYVRLGKYTAAEPLYTEAVSAERRTLGPENAQTLTTTNNLAVLFFREGKLAQAQMLYSQVLQIRRRTLGEEHPLTMLVRNNLALVYDSLGMYSEAEPLHVQVDEFDRRVLGEEHPNTLTTLANLGMLYRLQGRYAQAEPIMLKALDVGRRVQGEENPNTLLTKYNLAELYRDEGKRSQAEALFAAVYESRRCVLGATHPDTLATFASLARLRLQDRKYAGMEPPLRETLTAYESAASDDWRRYNIQSLLGASLVGQGKLAEAEPLLVGGYEGMLSRVATIAAYDRPIWREAGDRIIALYQNWGKPDKAAEWKRKLADNFASVKP